MEGVEKRLALLVGGSGGHDGDVHAARAVDLVEVDLGEDQLLGHAHGVVATAVEALGRKAAEVADARDGDGNEAVEELPHAVAAEGDLGADGLAGAQVEGCDGLAGVRDQGLLAGDGAQVCDGAVNRLGIGRGLANARTSLLPCSLLKSWWFTCGVSFSHPLGWQSQEPCPAPRDRIIPA